MSVKFFVFKIIQEINKNKLNKKIDLSKEKIFFLTKEQLVRIGANLMICDICTNKISIIFSNPKNW